jgi:CHAD domain-containing protein
VATRRLRATLRLVDECFPPRRVADWHQAIRRLTRALGPARDTDVQLAFLHKFRSDHPMPQSWPGLDRLILRLTQRRTALQTDVEHALDRLERSAVLADLETALRTNLVRSRLHPDATPSPDLSARAAHAITARLEEFLRYELDVPHPDRHLEHHAMRIAAKRLRYTLEVFAPPFGGALKEFTRTMRDFQELLGDLHDCDVWIDWLPQFLDEERARTQAYFGHTRPVHRLLPGLHALLEDRHTHRSIRYDEFVARWHTEDTQNLWPRLQALVHAQAREAAG